MNFVQQPDQAVVRSVSFLVGEFRRAKDYDRPIVQIDLCARAEARELFGSGEQVAKEPNRVGERELLELPLHGIVRQPLLNPIAAVSPFSRHADQTEDRRIDIEAQKVRLRLGKHLQKRPHDYLERRLIELVQRKPLTEEAICGEPLSNRGKVFESIKRASAVLCRMEKVGDND